MCAIFVFMIHILLVVLALAQLLAKACKVFFLVQVTPRTGRMQLRFLLAWVQPSTLLKLAQLGKLAVMEIHHLRMLIHLGDYGVVQVELKGVVQLELWRVVQ